MRTSALLGAAGVLALATLLSSAPVSAAPGTTRPDVRARSPLGTGTLSPVSLDPSRWKATSGVVPDAGAQALTAGSLDKHSIPLWQGTDAGYKFKMVGTDPSVPEGDRALTQIKTEVFPIIATFKDTGTSFNPTTSDTSCSPTGSAARLTMASPIFQPTSIAPGGTDIGTGEYPTDLFQRANFFTDTAEPGAINPDYGVDLKGVEESPIEFTVPLSVGETLDIGCDGIGLINAQSFDTALQQLITSSLRKIILPDTLPIFLLYNVVLFYPYPSDCCILGYHAAMRNTAHSRRFQTYVVADFDTSGLFDGSADITDLSHELAEWMDDPSGSNPTPPWGGVGQVMSGCQSNLEVGDPLVGNSFPVTMPNGYTYHPQDLAFKSWFYDDEPSTGVNGWYSFNGTFTSPAQPCL